MASLHAGTGSPVVVLHHSFGNPGWTALHARLAETHRVLVPDLPGFGLSERPEWARDVRDLAIVLGTWLEKQAIAPAVIVGCGFGGWVAAELATMSPFGISHLVLVGAAGVLPRNARIADQMLLSHSKYVKLAFKDDRVFTSIYGDTLSDDLLIT
jgi:pimeloyl-ACP methyl ester carboxylesterase